MIRLCFALTLLVFFVGVVLSPSQAEVPKHNVIIIAVDTVGYSHLKVLHQEKRLKTIGEFFNNGINFERAYSTAPWTKPSFASLFTSQ